MYDIVLSKEICRQIAFDIYDAVCRDVALEQKVPHSEIVKETEEGEKHEH